MKRKGFTLVELLIVVSLIIILVTAVLVLLNPMQQINKAKDSQKISDLDLLKKTFEDFYNDHNCYPKTVEACYPSNQSGYNPLINTKCYICGSQLNSPTLSPYLRSLPCDPNQPKKKYLYYIQGNANCPSSFKIYSDFNLSDSPISVDVGCGFGGCGIPTGYGYDYGVSSGNVSLDFSHNFFCLTKTNTCDNCLSLSNCSETPTCLKIYGTFDICCQENPEAVGC
jgi:prepilin-type N-terminal cleavage/methylation domain-containing protein